MEVPIPHYTLLVMRTAYTTLLYLLWLYMLCRFRFQARRHPHPFPRRRLKCRLLQGNSGSSCLLSKACGEGMSSRAAEARSQPRALPALASFVRVCLRERATPGRAVSCCQLRCTWERLVLSTQYLLLTTHHSLLTTHHLLLITHYLLRTTDYLRFTTYY